MGFCLFLPRGSWTPYYTLTDLSHASPKAHVPSQNKLVTIGTGWSPETLRMYCGAKAWRSMERGGRYRVGGTDPSFSRSYRDGHAHGRALQDAGSKGLWWGCSSKKGPSREGRSHNPPPGPESSADPGNTGLQVSFWGPLGSSTTWSPAEDISHCL